MAKTVFPFSRGATFEARFNLPESVSLEYFKTWLPYSQIRKAHSLDSTAAIDDLIFEWTAPTESNAFTLVNHDTEAWPLGEAVLDVLFIDPATGKKIRTKKFYIDIQVGVTEA